MSDILVTVLIMVVCLVAEGFFSGSEIGVVSADRMKLRHAAAKGSRGAKLALAMLEKPEWLLSTTLVGTNISVVTNTTMATALMIQLFGEGASWLAVALVAPLIWVFGEIVPKSVFQQRADDITPRAIFILKFFSYLFYPILAVFSFLARLLAKLVGGGMDAANPFTLREEIKMMVQMSPRAGDIEPTEQDMIRRLFNFEETTTREVMIPLLEVDMIEHGATCGEAREIAARRSHVRIPVYRERVDRVVGVLDLLELLGVDPDDPIRPYVRDVSYVPASKSIQNLLLDMRQQGEQVSVVVDEFGGAEGIVSIEDILEQVVKDIQDEYDADEPEIRMIRRQQDGSLLVNARVELSELEEELGIALTRGRYATLAGYLLEKAGEILQAGSSFEHKRLRFTVIRGSTQSIGEVRISRL